MDAAAVIADAQRRLVAMAENPPFVFRKTSQDLINAHLRRLVTFTGYTEQQVAEAEAQLGGRFPEVFRSYLREMGRRPGELFTGSDLAGIDEFPQFRADAPELAAEAGADLVLPPEAVVFLMHQGYTFVYLLATGGFDGPVFQSTEAEDEPGEAAPSFAALLDAELTLMEGVDRDQHAAGGYYLTLRPDGTATQTHPARNSGDRPLDRRRP